MLLDWTGLAICNIHSSHSARRCFATAQCIPRFLTASFQQHHNGIHQHDPRRPPFLSIPRSLSFRIPVTKPTSESVVGPCLPKPTPTSSSSAPIVLEFNYIAHLSTFTIRPFESSFSCICKLCPSDEPYHSTILIIGLFSIVHAGSATPSQQTDDGPPDRLTQYPIKRLSVAACVPAVYSRSIVRGQFAFHNSHIDLPRLLFLIRCRLKP